jgi:hypothetical protein
MSFLNQMERTPGNKIVHLVSFNVPYPPDYGGIMDVFYKIVTLKRQGVGVILHCFSYGRSRSRTLERECLRVHYYRRDLNLFHLFSREPFIVLSRKNDMLLKDLQADNQPVIFEGLHTTYYIDHPSLQGRIIMVRTHNIEHTYYRNLAHNEKNPFRKLYFLTEAKKLERYEPRLASASWLLSISPGDTEYFSSRYGNAMFVGPFHPGFGGSSSNGRGDYVLLHGDLSTAENNAAALYILKNVVPHWKYRTVLAGKRPSPELSEAAAALSHVKVIPNPSMKEMEDLVANAQVCLLNASQPTGMKLKLINSLWSGRHVISSPAVVSGTGLGRLCHVAANPGEWISLTDSLMTTDFTVEMRNERYRLLSEVADNEANARKLIDALDNYNPEK